MVRGTDAGSGRTDVPVHRPALVGPAAPGRHAPALGVGDLGGERRPPTVCLVVSNSFSAPPAPVRTTPGMPLELTIDVVPSSGTPRPGPSLGSGWMLLAVLAVGRLLAGLITGLARPLADRRMEGELTMRATSRLVP